MGLFNKKNKFSWSVYEEKKYKKKYKWLGLKIQDIYSIYLRDEAVKNRDIDGLFDLTGNGDFEIGLLEIFEAIGCEKLNHPQKVLYLCMHIENAGQADTVLSFLQEEFSTYSNEVIKALYEIGAIKSAKIIEQIVEMLSKNEGWFYDTADKESEKQFNKLDTEFSSYPDGNMPKLYRAYAEKHKADIIYQDRSDYVKLTDGEMTLEFMPVSYEFDYDEKRADEGYDNNWVNVHCLFTYKGKVYLGIDPAWLVADMHETNDIKETIGGISSVLSGELQEYHARFFDPCFFNLLFVRSQDNYLATVEYHFHEPKTKKLEWIKFDTSLSKNELEKIMYLFKKYDSLFPCRE